LVDTWLAITPPHLHCEGYWCELHCQDLRHWAFPEFSNPPPLPKTGKSGREVVRDDLAGPSTDGQIVQMTLHDDGCSLEAPPFVELGFVSAKR